MTVRGAPWLKPRCRLPRPSGSRTYGHLPDAGQQRALIAVKAQLEHSLPCSPPRGGKKPPCACAINQAAPEFCRSCNIPHYLRNGNEFRVNGIYTAKPGAGFGQFAVDNPAVRHSGRDNCPSGLSNLSDGAPCRARTAARVQSGEEKFAKAIAVAALKPQPILRQTVSRLPSLSFCLRQARHLLRTWMRARCWSAISTHRPIGAANM
jgi:hypothetical protein